MKTPNEMKQKYTLDEMKRAFETGRNFQLTGENNFKELIEELNQALLSCLGDVIPSTSFTLTWKNVKDELPKEGARYWCIVEEVNDLGISYFQWNCYYEGDTKKWIDDGKESHVIWWTELAPRPIEHKHKTQPTMDAKQLMIGNWVHSNVTGKDFQISAKQIADINNDPTVCSPIEITNGWLYVLNFEFFIRNDVIVWAVHGRFLIWYFEGKGWNIKEVPYRNDTHYIKYVHELQNLKFLLTGQ